MVIDAGAVGDIRQGVTGGAQGPWPQGGSVKGLTVRKATGLPPNLQECAAGTG